MRVPYRKPGKFSNQKNDPFITQDKFKQFVEDLDRLKNIVRPKLAAEVARLAELGDFSENAEYQLAKGKLRGTNNAILKLTAQINDAQIIAPKNSNTVQIGNTVTVECNGKEKIYQILGSVETRPGEGIISYSSPLGEVLVGKKVGDDLILKAGGKETQYKIIKIE